MNRISPKKLLNTKWTATNPVKKEKHFMVVQIVKPEVSAVSNEIQDAFQFIKIEAVYSKTIYQIDWLDLKDQSQWRQGWV
jgi:tryptophan-rich hypothetical protein